MKKQRLIVCKLRVLPLVFLLAFSFLVTGCDWDNPLGNTEPKSIEISQIPSEYQGKYIMVDLYRVTNAGNLMGNLEATSFFLTEIITDEVTIDLFTPDNTEFRGYNYYAIFASIFEGNTTNSELLWARRFYSWLETATTTCEFDKFILHQPQIDTQLISAWYDNQANADVSKDKIYEFRADGRFLPASGNDEGILWSTNSGLITLSSVSGQLIGTTTYTIFGTKLNIATTITVNSVIILPNGDKYKPERFEQDDS